jgi:hypothetical protein
MLRLLALFLTAFTATAAFAADIRVFPGPTNDLQLITITGEFELGDDKKFIQIALPVDRAVVAFSSDGGNLSAGLEIGRAIHLKEFSTLVPSNSVCASACGLAWLGGIDRAIGPGALVGFHAAYIEKDGAAQETGMGNAFVGAYLNQLGLTQSAIAYVTHAAPENMKWLTAEDAKAIGIEMRVLTSNDPSSAPNNNPSIPPTFPTTQLPVSTVKRVASADIYGFDLPNMPLKGSTLVLCEQACEANRDCKAYTFTRRNSACFLKSSGFRVLGNPQADAGYKTEIEASLHASTITVYERTDLPGGDYKDLSSVTFEQCTDYCETDRRCASFTYTRRSSTCWLKSTVPTPKPFKAGISGVKAAQ